MHTHAFAEEWRNENDNRIRIRETCSCGAVRYGCFAKRLDGDGSNAWGPVGEWWYRVREPAA